MNITTVRDNLINTIRNKETHLAGLRENVAAYDARDDQCDTWLVAKITADFLAINIDELKRILYDIDSVVFETVDTSAQKLYN